MSKFPKLSGKKIIKVLIKGFNFEIARQRGSHVVLRKFERDEKIVTVVPLHKEVRIGTLLGILDLAKIKKKKFIEALEK